MFFKISEIEVEGKPVGEWLRAGTDVYVACLGTAYTKPENSVSGVTDRCIDNRRKVQLRVKASEVKH